MLFTKVNPRRRNASFPVAFDGLIKDVMNTSFGDLLDEQFAKTKPAANVIQDEDGYHLELAIPGLSKENIELNVEKDVLTISAKKAEKKEETTTETEVKKKYTRREFDYSDFKRVFHLNETIDTKRIAANFENGVLSVNLPIKAEVKEEETLREIKID